MSDKPATLTVTTEVHNNAVIVHCHGKLVYGVGDLLYKPVTELMDHHKRIILDFEHLSHMDSMGLGVLVRLYVASKGKHATIELRNLGKKINELLIMANLMPVFTSVGEHRNWM